MSAGFVSAAKEETVGRPVTSRRRLPREARRIPHRVPCRVQLYDPDSGHSAALIGATVDISKRGLAVQLRRDVSPGTWVEALLPHVNGDPIFVCGTVAYSRRVLAETYEIGIQFADALPPPVF